jgi:MFS family permease
VIVLRGMYAAAFFGAEAFVPLMLVRERGLSPTLAGLALTGGAVGWATGSWLQSRPWFPVPRHLLLAGGGLLVGLAVLSMTVATRHAVPAWVALPVWMVGGAGMGLAMASTSVLVLRLSDPGQEGRNSAALQVSDGFGSVLGIGGAGALFAALHDPGGSDAPAFRLMWLILGVVGLLSFLVAFRARPRPA